MPEYIVNIENNKITEVKGLVRCENCLRASRQYGKEIICSLNWKEKKKEGYCDEAVMDRSNE